MNILLIGGGKLVFFLARLFHSEGYNVTIINKNKEECVSLARNLRSIVIEGDGSDPNILHEAGAHIAEFLLAVTDSDHDNLAICQIAKTHFGIPNTLSLVNDPDNEIVFKELGFKAVSTTNILANLIEQQSVFKKISTQVPIGEGKVNVMEVTLDETSPVLNIPLKDLKLPEDSIISYILRGNEPIIPRGHTVLQKDDRVLVITLPKTHAKTIRLLTGEEN